MSTKLYFQRQKHIKHIINFYEAFWPLTKTFVKYCVILMFSLVLWDIFWVIIFEIISPVYLWHRNPETVAQLHGLFDWYKKLPSLSSMIWSWAGASLDGTRELRLPFIRIASSSINLLTGWRFVEKQKRVRIEHLLLENSLLLQIKRIHILYQRENDCDNVLIVIWYLYQ